MTRWRCSLNANWLHLGRVGAYDLDDGVRVHARLAPDLQAQTLWHEARHAILSERTSLGRWAQYHSARAVDCEGSGPAGRDQSRVHRKQAALFLEMTRTVQEAVATAAEATFAIQRLRATPANYEAAIAGRPLSYRSAARRVMSVAIAATVGLENFALRHVALQELVDAIGIGSLNPLLAAEHIDPLSTCRPLQRTYARFASLLSVDTSRLARLVEATFHERVHAAAEEFERVRESGRQSGYDDIWSNALAALHIIGDSDWSPRLARELCAIAALDFENEPPKAFREHSPEPALGQRSDGGHRGNYVLPTRPLAAAFSPDNARELLTALPQDRIVVPEFVVDEQAQTMLAFHVFDATGKTLSTLVVYHPSAAVARELVELATRSNPQGFLGVVIPWHGGGSHPFTKTFLFDAGMGPANDAPHCVAKDRALHLVQTATDDGPLWNVLPAALHIDCAPPDASPNERAYMQVVVGGFWANGLYESTEGEEP